MIHHESEVSSLFKHLISLVRGKIFSLVPEYSFMCIMVLNGNGRYPLKDLKSPSTPHFMETFSPHLHDSRCSQFFSFICAKV